MINISKDEIRDKMFFVREEDSDQIIAVVKVADLLKKEERRMTNKEAIELLKRATMFEPTLENRDYPEALDLAIKALEREAQWDADNAFREKKWGKEK